MVLLLITRVKPPLPVDWLEVDAGRSLTEYRLLLTPFRYPPLATVLAERAFHGLRLPEGSPLPAQSCMYRRNATFSVQIHTAHGLLLQH